MKDIKIIALIASTCLAQQSYATVGCIAMFRDNVPVAIEVELPAFKGGLFQNDQFRFSNLPKNMQPDASGKYCYDLNDMRFAFVQTYYYAINELNYFDDILNQSQLPLLQKLTWTLQLDTTSPTSGNTDSKEGVIHFPRPAVDPLVIAHEIGHVVSFTVTKNSLSTALNAHKSYKATDVNVIEHDAKLLINEGSANLLGALYSGSPLGGKADSYDNLVDLMNDFVRFPDLLPTARQSIQKEVTAPIYAKHYPERVKEFLALLAQYPNDNSLLDRIDPYQAAAAINQPLWDAVPEYGSKVIARIYLTALHRIDNKTTYPMFADAIVNSAYQFNIHLANTLSIAYKMRGLTS